MTRLVVFFSCGLLLGCSQQPGPTTTSGSAGHAAASSGEEATQVAFNIDGNPTVEFEVPGMMCPHGCVPKVREAFAEQPGVKDVQVVYATKTAIVAINEREFNPADAAANLEDEFGFSGTRLKNADLPSIDEGPSAGTPDQAG